MADYETIEYIQSVINEVLTRAGVQARIEYEDSLVNGLVFNIRSRDAKLLIGHQGTTLYALEHIIHSIVSRHLAHAASTTPSENPSTDNRVFFSIDIDDYKRNRQYQIKQLIKDEVSNMKRSGKTSSLPAMSKYERKFAHMYIQEQFPHVTTESAGVEPNRYIKMMIE
jgi:predicted RNA-binding protein Jag